MSETTNTTTTTNLMGISFKKGSYDDFKSKIVDQNKSVPGALYFTTDEGGLYLGVEEDKAPKRIQGVVQYYDSTTAFKQATKPPYSSDVIYYLANENALIRWDSAQNEGAGGFIILNVTASEFSSTVASFNEKIGEIKLTETKDGKSEDREVSIAEKIGNIEDANNNKISVADKFSSLETTISTLGELIGTGTDSNATSLVDRLESLEGKVDVEGTVTGAISSSVSDLETRLVGAGEEATENDPTITGAKMYADNAVNSAEAELTAAIATAKGEAIDAAAQDATKKANDAKGEAIDAAAQDATKKANDAKDAAIAEAAEDATKKANDAKNAAIAEATGKVEEALAAAKKYAEDQAKAAEETAASKLATAKEEISKEIDDDVAALGTALDERLNVLEKHNHSSYALKTELNGVKEELEGKITTAQSTATAAKERIDTFLDTEGVADTVDTLHDIKAWMEGDGVDATELTAAIAGEADARAAADTALGERIDALSTSVDTRIGAPETPGEGDAINPATGLYLAIDTAKNAAITAAATDATTKANAAEVNAKTHAENYTDEQLTLSVSAINSRINNIYYWGSFDSATT